MGTGGQSAGGMNFAGGQSGVGGLPATGGAPGGSGVLMSGGSESGGTADGNGGTSSGGANSGGTSSGGASADGAGGAPVTSSACDNPSFLFCDDFESYTQGESPDGAWYEYSDQYGAPIIETSAQRAFSGSQSVNFRVSASGGRAFLNTDAPFPVPDDVFYGRMMIFLESVPGSAHWDIISAYGGDDVCGGNYRWGGQFGHTLANYHPGDCYQHFNSLVPVEGKWLCYEWKFDGPAKEMHAWIDDFEMNDSNHAVLTGHGQGCANAGNCPANNYPGEEWVAPEWSHLSIGWAHYQSEGEAPSTWIDDVVIDETRVGCPVLP